MTVNQASDSPNVLLCNRNWHAAWIPELPNNVASVAPAGFLLLTGAVQNKQQNLYQNSPAAVHETQHHCQSSNTDLLERYKQLKRHWVHINLATPTTLCDPQGEIIIEKEVTSKVPVFWSAPTPRFLPSSLRVLKIGDILMALNGELG